MSPRGKTTGMALAALAALTLPAEARAQESYSGVPSFLPPRPGDHIGVYLSRPYRADFGVGAIWRRHGDVDLGVRVGFIDFPADHMASAAVETWGGIVDAGEDFPVDVSWTLGVGASLGWLLQLEMPVGITIGRTFVLNPLALQIYGHPRLALLTAVAGGVTASELQGLFDLGADLRLGEQWKVAIGITFGGTDPDFDRVVNTVGAGLAYRFGGT